MVEPDLNPASLVPESLLLYHLCDTIKMGGGAGSGRLYVMVNRKVLDSGPSVPCRGGGGGVGEKDQNWGLVWVEGSSVRGEGRD